MAEHGFDANLLKRSREGAGKVGFVADESAILDDVGRLGAVGHVCAGRQAASSASSRIASRLAARGRPAAASVL